MLDKQQNPLALILVCRMVQRCSTLGVRLVDWHAEAQKRTDCFDASEPTGKAERCELPEVAKERRLGRRACLRVRSF